MPNLNVHVVDSNNKPVSGAKVFVLIHHSIMPDTWLEKRTGRDGDADFKVPDYNTVDVYVNGDVEEEGISLGSSSKGITISI